MCQWCLTSMCPRNTLSKCLSYEIYNLAFLARLLGFAGYSFHLIPKEKTLPKLALGSRVDTIIADSPHCHFSVVNQSRSALWGPLLARGPKHLPVLPVGMLHLWQQSVLIFVFLHQRVCIIAKQELWIHPAFILGFNDLCFCSIRTKATKVWDVIWQGYNTHRCFYFGFVQ